MNDSGAPKLREGMGMGEGWPSRGKYVSMNVTYFAAIAAFAIAFSVAMLYKPGIPTAQDLDRLTTGMTPEQVRSILGEPKIAVQAATVPGSPEETWTYYLPASRWSVTNQAYQLKFYEGALDSWWKVK